MDTSFKLGSYRVNSRACTITGEHGTTNIEPKAMALLVSLAEANGELVSRIDLFNIIWGEQVVSDYALNTLVANLRKSLGDDAGSSQYIETRPKLGYRLVPKVEFTELLISKKVTDIRSPVDGLEGLNSNKSNWLKKKWPVIILFSCVGLMGSLFVKFQYDNPSVLTENSPISPILQYRYISRVNIAVEFSDVKVSGEPICINTDADFVARLVYSENQWSLKNYKWTLYSDFYDIDLTHKKDNLAGISESHEIEHGHPYGVVRESMKISFDESEDFNGSSEWSVYGSENKILCTGTALFIAQKM